MNPKKSFYILLICFVCSICLLSCNYSKEVTTKKQWVYIELNTVSLTDTSDYYYYGQIKSSIIDEINTNENKEGLFTLSNIRFMNDDELLEVYESNELQGDMMFRIQDIEEIVFYKDDPVNLFDIEELHASSKAIRKTK